MSDVTLQAAFGGMIDRQKRGINETRAEEAVQNEVAFSPYEVEWHEQQHGGWYGYGLTSPTGHAELEYEASVGSSYIASHHIESIPTPYSMLSSQRAKTAQILFIAENPHEQHESAWLVSILSARISCLLFRRAASRHLTYAYAEVML